MSIRWPTNTVTVIDEIRDAIGRNIDIYYKVSGIACTNPDDSLDPVTNLSTNQFCTVCSGNYWLNTVSGYTVKAHVAYNGIDEPLWYTGGRIFDGDLQAQIKYTVSAYSAVENSDYFVVDSKTYTLKNYKLRGVPDINRILITLIEVDNG